MEKQSFITLAALPVSQKLTYTMTLLVLSIGYLFAMVHTYDSHSMNDGQPEMTVSDLVIAYSGNHSDTQLESAIKGSMFNMLHDDDRAVIVEWVQSGATVEQFDEAIRPIITEHCVVCHNGSDPHKPNLDGYDNLRAMVKIDKGMDIGTLVRISHIHLFGLTFIFYLTSSIFFRAHMKNTLLKRSVIVLPYLAIMTDIFSWYLTKVYESFAMVVFASGGILAICFAIQWFISMYQMWFMKSQVERTTS